MDEIAEWLDEIVEDVRGSDSNVESLLEDIIPVKAVPTGLHIRRHEEATLRAKKRGKSPRLGKSPRGDADALLESIRAYKKRSGGATARRNGSGSAARAGLKTTRRQKAKNNVPPPRPFAPKFARQYVSLQTQAR